jgi:hypothetical protein
LPTQATVKDGFSWRAARFFTPALGTPVSPMNFFWIAAHSSVRVPS